MRSEDASARPSSSSLLGFLRRSHSASLALICGMSLASGAASAAAVVVVGYALGHARPGDPKPAAVFVALCLAMIASAMIAHLTLVRVSKRAVYDLQLLLSRRILATPLAELEQLGPHRLLGTLTEDVNAIANGLRNVGSFVTSTVVVAACLAYVGSLSWKVLVLVVVVVVVGVVGFLSLSGIARGRLRAAREAYDALLAQLRALVEGAKELKLHRGRRHRHLEEVLPATAGAVRDLGASAENVLGMAGEGARLALLLLVGAVVFVWPRLEQVDSTAVAGCAFAILYMTGPLQELVMAFAGHSRATAAMLKVHDLGLTLDRLAAEGDDDAPPGPALASWDRLELLGVGHTYRDRGSDEKFVLGPLDLSIRPGELVFIVGGNGSGKTTLAKILAGLYTPGRGRIVLGGRTVTPSDREWYRQHFSAVFADFFLLDDLRGIGLAADELRQRSRDHLARLELSDKVSIEDGRFSTTALSQGQRRRLALCAAFLEDRPIYVLDEWAAEQDPIYKRLFYTELLPELKRRGKAIVIVSHDDRYFSLADQIIKLEDGQLLNEATASFMVRLAGGPAASATPAPK